MWKSRPIESNIPASEPFGNKYFNTVKYITIESGQRDNDWITLMDVTRNLIYEHAGPKYGNVLEHSMGDNIPGIIVMSRDRRGHLFTQITLRRPMPVIVFPDGHIKIDIAKESTMPGLRRPTEPEGR